MDKRILGKIERDTATPEMIQIAGRIDGMEYMCRAKLVQEEVMLLTFFKTANLKKGKPEAIFRTFLSKDDYINQDMTVSKTKWTTSSFYGMNGFCLIRSKCDEKYRNIIHIDNTYIASTEEMELIKEFFKVYKKEHGKEDSIVWEAVMRFQDYVKAKRLQEKYRKETDPIDQLMATVQEIPAEVIHWAKEEAMSFSRYLMYEPKGKKEAVCQCSYCKKTIVVNREEVRLRNNEKGVCPSCGSAVTIKAKGRTADNFSDERWCSYVERRDDGFVWRYFIMRRRIEKGALQIETNDWWHENVREFYTFPNGAPKCDSYEWNTFRASGKTRWCHDDDKWYFHDGTTLYPYNLPEAWEHTPMKYSALELLAAHEQSKTVAYPKGIRVYSDFPRLEHFIKMGLYELSTEILSGGNTTGKLHTSGKTIFEILGLNKVNTRVLQAIDGNHDVLRLLQVAQLQGIQFKPDELKRYYETFSCNTELLKRSARKVSIHKLVKYIEKESQNYPIGEQGRCWQYSYMMHHERPDARIERKQNMAKDWTEYLDTCKKLKYDTDNMFVFMPNNFKKVHDRVMKEYQDLQDRKAAEEKRRQELKAKREMEKTRKAMEEIFKVNDGATNAFSIKGKELILVVPKSGDEIRAEGEALHHCVGGYVSRVARGETNIFFIRKEKEPDKSYFTMEWKDGGIVQCRGSHNCGMPPEVKAFVKVFEKLMNSAREKENTDKERVQVAC